MTQEEKELLLKALCARLPYLENWVQYDGKDYVVSGYGHGRVLLLSSMFSSVTGPCPLVEEVKLYLRPMSSMTDEEKTEFRRFITWTFDCDYQANTLKGILNGNEIETEHIVEFFDWLNDNHFDYRGLIPMGLALEAKEGFYKIKKK